MFLASIQIKVLCKILIKSCVKACAYTKLTVRKYLAFPVLTILQFCNFLSPSGFSFAISYPIRLQFFSIACVHQNSVYFNCLCGLPIRVQFFQLPVQCAHQASVFCNCLCPSSGFSLCNCLCPLGFSCCNCL